MQFLIDISLKITPGSVGGVTAQWLSGGWNEN